MARGRSGAPSGSGYRALLSRPGFPAYLWSQFLGAFNDNVSRWIVTLVAMDRVAGRGSQYAGLIGGLFTAPSLLFAGTSGWLADVRSKREVIIAVKAFEVAAMAYGWFALISGRLGLILAIPFLMGLHATFFSPAKYGIVPECLPERELSRANGVLEMTTFLAIILGTSVGGLLYQAWKDSPGALNLVLVGVATAGFLCSLGVPRVRAASPGAPFPVNPFGGVVRGVRALRRDPPAWSAAVGITFFWFLGAFLLTIIAPLGKQVMGLDDRSTSLLETCLAAGIGAGSLLAGRLSGDRIRMGLVGVGAVGMGGSALALAAWHASWGAAAAALTALGAFAGLFAVPLNARLQQRADRRQRGTILATNNFMNSAGMVAAFGLLILFGAVLRWTPPVSIALMGLLTLGVAAVGGRSAVR